TARTLRSHAASSRASPTAVANSELTALRAWGRLKVISPMCPCRSYVAAGWSDTRPPLVAQPEQQRVAGGVMGIVFSEGVTGGHQGPSISVAFAIPPASHIVCRP